MDELFESVVKKINKVPYGKWRFDGHWDNCDEYVTQMDNFKVEIIKWGQKSLLKKAFGNKKRYSLEITDDSTAVTKKFEGRNDEIRSIYEDIENAKNDAAKKAALEAEEAAKEAALLKKQEFESKLAGYFSNEEV